MDNIDHGKCGAWIDLLFAIMKMTKELTADEKKHIMGSLAIAFGNLQLEELEEKNKLKEKEGVA